MGYVSQTRELDPEKTIYEVISEEGVVDNETKIRQYVASFNFKGQTQEKLVENLSGGERNRVHIAKTLRSGCNLLLLDEPTNDLDVEVLRNLEEGLSNFTGSIIVISHDRWFLDRIVTHILSFEVIYLYMKHTFVFF